MKVNIEERAKEELGKQEYKRLLKFLFWLKDKLQISSAARVEVIIQHDIEDNRLGSVAPYTSQNLKIMLNTGHYSDKDILNPVTGRYNDWFSTAAHEMVHCRQWTNYQLTSAGSYYWESKRYHKVDDTKLSYQKYVELPWEMEAFSLQNPLYQEWLDTGEPDSL